MGSNCTYNPGWCCSHPTVAKPQVLSGTLNLAQSNPTVSSSCWPSATSSWAFSVTAAHIRNGLPQHGTSAPSLLSWTALIFSSASEVTLSLSATLMFFSVVLLITCCQCGCMLHVPYCMHSLCSHCCRLSYIVGWTTAMLYW